MATKYPEHNLSYFYKYYSVNTAKTVLSKKTLQYTPPLSFNDPFDIQTDLYFDFSHEDFVKKFFPRFLNILKGKEQSSYNLPFYIPQMPSLDWETLPNNTSQKIMDILQELFSKIQNYYNIHWKSMLPKVRVFCVSEINDNILMWSHYAENHEGVCIKLKVIPENDNHLCAAKKVIYTKTPPSITNVFNQLTIDDWIDIFLGQSQQNDTSDFLRFVLFKSCIWSYEKEWRVWFPSEIEQPSKPFYQKLDKDELDSIYFGCKCKEEDIFEIRSLAKDFNPETCFYRGKKDKTKYKINFEKI